MCMRGIGAQSIERMAVFTKERWQVACSLKLVVREREGPQTGVCNKLAGDALSALPDSNG